MPPIAGQRPLFRNLATGRPIKDAPQGEFVGEVLVMMLGSRSNEQQIAQLERVALAVVHKNAPAANDDVDLVLCMR